MNSDDRRHNQGVTSHQERSWLLCKSQWMPQTEQKIDSSKVSAFKRSDQWWHLKNKKLITQDPTQNAFGNKNWENKKNCNPFIFCYNTIFWKNHTLMKNVPFLLAYNYNHALFTGCLVSGTYGLFADWGIIGQLSGLAAWISIWFGNVISQNVLVLLVSRICK